MMHALYVLLSAFLDICLLRRGPQDLPYSPVLLTLTSFIYLLINFVLAPEQLTVKEMVLWSLSDTLLLVILTSSLLYFTHYTARIVQTLTGLIGSYSLLGLFYIPLIFWLQEMKSDVNTVTFPEVLLFGLAIWSLVVHAHILRHALNVSLIIGFILTFITYFLEVSLLSQLFPLLLVQ